MTRLLSLLLLLAMNTICWAEVDEGSRAEVVEVLAAPSFWNMDGRKDARTWTTAQRDVLGDLARNSDDPALRLRAGKLVADMAGRSRYDANQEEVVIAAFRFLEGRSDDPEVHRLCLEQHFTHFRVARHGDGSAWFLIEHIEGGGFNGGLNLKWNAVEENFVEMNAWGGVAAKAP